MSFRRGRGELHRFSELLGAGLAVAAGAVRGALGQDVFHAIGYRSFGTSERALLLGRVLEDEGVGVADASHSRWRNLYSALKRIEADPLPFARVRARVNGAVFDLTADDEGFLGEWISPRLPLAGGWNDVELELLDPPRGQPSSGTTLVLVPPASARFGVVSDMDDTVLQSEITAFLRAARLMLLENARTRLPFPGVAACYRALHDAGGASNPIFYVSSSPWNLYDVIADFLAAQEIPAGPLLLRDWDVRPSLLRNREYKTARIREIFATYPALPFILVGDSGQEDPEIYSELVRENPGRVLAVYIRNVSHAPERAEAIRALAAEVRLAGSTLVLADDTLAVARHAAMHGWLDNDRLADIAGDKRDDEGATTEKVETPGVHLETAPTVVVDDEVKASDVE